MANREYDDESLKESGMCRHGNAIGNLCEACLAESKESQPAWAIIEKLRQGSKFARSTLDSTECVVEREGRRYVIETVRPDDDATLNQVQALLEETFGAEEVDPLEVLKSGVRGVTSTGETDECRYRIFVVRDEAGQILSLYAGGQLELRDATGQPTGESMFMSAYGVTRKDQRQGGLLREAYVSALIGAAAEAQARGKKFSLVGGECTYTSELAWNALGQRRIYLGTGGRELAEIKYVQPALEFDPDTGLPAEDAGEAPEHLMVQALGGDVTKEKISQVVAAIYRWCNRYPRAAFNSDAAYRAHREYVDRLQRQFDDLLSGPGELKLLTAKEREQTRAAGSVVKDYAEADHGDTGPEDA